MPRFRVELKRTEVKVYEAILDAPSPEVAERKAVEIAVPADAWHIVDRECDVRVMEIQNGGDGDESAAVS